MKQIEKVYAFDSLIEAYHKARLGKRGTLEEINFEIDLARNITMLSDSIKKGTYRLSGYYSFTITDPKQRDIHALHFIDRVVQHSLCDNVIAPEMEKRLIYENAACRVGKGTDFAIGLLEKYLLDSYKHAKEDVWILKCDIKKFFDSIDHEILKQRLSRIFKEQEIINLLYMIIDSYEVSKGKGIPLGNQTSQWFALYYLDPLDRQFKEKLRLKKYVRYMDDIIVVGKRSELQEALKAADTQIKSVNLEFNVKTQIFPLKNGIGFLGWRFRFARTGRLLKRVSQTSAIRFKRCTKTLAHKYHMGQLPWETIAASLQSYGAHLLNGDTIKLRQAVFGRLMFYA